MIKKTIFYITICFIIFSSITLAGCNNENKTLARNLDDTIANLVYSVSSLDWADSSTLKNLNNSQNLINQNTYSTPQTITNPQFNNELGLSTKNQNELYNNSQTNNYPTINNTQLKENIALNYTPENRHSRPHRRFPNHHKINNYQNQNNVYFNPKFPEEINNSITTTNNNLTSYTAQPKRTLTTNNNQDNIMMVTYSTENIENKYSNIQETITELINMRANILLYINDLYKGYVNLNNDGRKAINAYINIVKDNTSYLNKNRGMISNQLNQANDLFATNSSSPLINAYIIRTEEAIETRLAKINSSILAIQSICDIISCSLNENSPNFNNQLSNNSEILESKISQDNSIINDSKINNSFDTLENSISNINNITQTSDNLNNTIVPPEGNPTVHDITNNQLNKVNLQTIQDEITQSRTETPQFTTDISSTKNCDNCFEEISQQNTPINNCIQNNNCQVNTTSPDTCSECENYNNLKSASNLDECNTKQNSFITPELNTPTTNTLKETKNNIDAKLNICDETISCSSICFIDKNRRNKQAPSKTTSNNYYELTKGYTINNEQTVKTMPYLS